MVAMRQASPILTSLGPAWFRRLTVDLLPIPQVQQLKHVVDVLHDTSVQIIGEKKAALEQGKVYKDKDIISILRRFTVIACLRCQLTEYVVHSASQHGSRGRGEASGRTDYWADVVCRFGIVLMATSC